MNNYGKTNNKAIMLICSILLLLIIAAVIFEKTFGNNNKTGGYNITNNIVKPEYARLEKKLSETTIKYIKDKGLELEENAVITSKKLINNNYLNEFKDSQLNNCEGYTVYSKKKYYTYIKCGIAHSTRGYNNSLMEAN